VMRSDAFFCEIASPQKSPHCGLAGRIFADLKACKFLKTLAHQTGIELATFRLTLRPNGAGSGWRGARAAMTTRAEPRSRRIKCSRIASWSR
jgi:hypothetical protein